MPGVLHWGPLTALTIISVVTITATYSALQLWNLPTVKYFKLPNFILMYVWLFFILKNFYQALQSPGYVEYGWKPAVKSNESFMQYCKECQGFKPPRSHHCRQCGRCVLKMDHHCPWVNSCVGHRNQAAFTRFLFYVPFGCMHGAIVNSNFIYRLVVYDLVRYRRFLYLTINSFWLIFVVAGIGLAIGATLGVLLLFIVQMKSICVNKTQIEEWIVDKARRRRRDDQNAKPFVFPYDLGRWKNFTQVINFSGTTKGDGIHWPVIEGCTQYTFTLEQITQKKAKRVHATVCTVKTKYRGSYYPISFGLMTCVCTPKCTEGKIAVDVGDIINVTRWQTYWVYGEKHSSLGQADQSDIKGWLPQQCVEEVKDSAIGEVKERSEEQKHNSDTVRKRL